MAGLRITGGRARGRVLRGVVGPDVRPTSSRVREALFSIVGQDLSGLRVLDAFGGAGLLGLEAWSRGAEVVIVERDARAARVIRDHVAALGASCEVRTGDVLRLGVRLGPFDAVVCDPPYAQAPEPVLQTLGPLVEGWLMYEADRRTSLPAALGGLALERTRTFGDTQLALYRSVGRRLGADVGNAFEPKDEA